MTQGNTYQRGNFGIDSMSGGIISGNAKIAGVIIDINALAPPPPLTTIPQNIPHLGTRTFVGRSDSLQEIDEYFEKSNQIAITSAIQSLTGMGGVGKTELAVQYALRYQTKYQGGICWLAARNADIAIQIVSFCNGFDVNPPDDFIPKDKVKYCYNHWIEGKVLIIFDDVKSYQDIKSYLPPQNDKFKVIATSRQSLGRLEQLRLKVLKPEEAFELLQQILGEERVNPEIEETKQLCQWLGYLPLGLELVGRYLIVYESLSIKEVIKRLERSKLKAKALLDPKDDQTDMTAQLGIASAFELSWHQLSPEAQKLGCYLSLFKSNLFNWLWVESSYLDSEQASEEELEDLEALRVEELQKFNLLQGSQEDKKLFSYHTLISYYFESKLNDLEDHELLKIKFCQGMVKLAQSISETPIKQELDEFSIVVSHLKTVATEINQYIDNQDLTWPFIGLGKFYEGQTNYQEAEKWYKQCLLICQKRLGEEHPDVAISIGTLASLYKSQGRYTEAEPLCLQALSLCKKLLGEEHPDVALSINNLAALYDSQGRYTEAEPLYLQALSLRKKLLGEEHRSVALSINNLAGLYYSQGRYTEAEPLLIQALSLYKKLLGEEHPHVALSINNLAELYRSQGRYTEAEPLLIQALSLYKKLFGEEHPDVATSINNLAELYDSQGRYTEAESLYLQALFLLKKLLGEEHPHVALSINNLAALYESQGKYTEAEPLFLQALSLWKKVLGEEHPDVALSINNLALLYNSQGRYAEAEPLYLQALSLRKKLLGEEHPHVATSINNLAFLYDSQGRYTEAEPLYLQALQIFEKVLGENHPSTKTVRDNYELLKEQNS